MFAFVAAVMQLLAFADEGWHKPPGKRQVEVREMAEVLAAHVCAVLLLAGTMTGLAAIFVQLIQFVRT